MNSLPEDDPKGLFGFGLPDDETRDIARMIYTLLLQEIKAFGISIGNDPTRHIAIKAGYKQIMIFIVNPLLAEHLDRLKNVVLVNVPAGYPCEFVFLS